MHACVLSLGLLGAVGGDKEQRFQSASARNYRKKVNIYELYS